MFRKNEFLTYLCWTLMCCGVVYTCTSCMFPTNDDVNRLTRADHDFVSGEHSEIVESFTEQFVLQSPELAPELRAVVDQYNSAVAELRVLADEVTSEGLDATELVALVAASVPGLGGLVWLNREKTKPSRSAEKVAKLESDLSEAIKELAEVKLALATAAKVGAAMPSDSLAA